MNVFELLFILLFLASAVTLVWVVIGFLTRRAKRAAVVLRRFAIGAGAYLAIVFIVSAATPAKVLNVGDEQRNDDWCIAVANVNWLEMGPRRACDVTLRLSNRGRGRAQRERGVRVYLVDAAWQRYEPIPRAFDLPLDTLIQAGQSVSAERHFELPADARDVGLVVDHGAGFPGCLIITENNWFHRLPVVRLE